MEISLPSGSRVYRPLFYDALMSATHEEVAQERSRLAWLTRNYKNEYDPITGINLLSVARARLYQVEKEMERRRALQLGW